ncbi:hypothetical protein ACI0FN_01883 [Alcaligenes nematophilus]|uniref:DUF2235 domain-containing protein n=1 Tax=Alcaligenes nematophilus TaxID=2994643 RepID=UPI0038517A87
MINKTEAVGDDTLPRNIAIFIDGTWNHSDSHSHTNVRKLFEATAEGVVNGRKQSKLYISGVGTRPNVETDEQDGTNYNVELWPYLSKACIHTKINKLFGGLTGFGTAARIQATYHYLCKNFRNKSSDRLFLFGFSRGALAARSLAGFIGKVGLLFADNLEHVQRAYELYENSEDATQSELSAFLYQLTGRGFVHSDEKLYVPTHFLGVWDTVGALGLPRRLQWFTAPFTEYHQDVCPPSIVTARHALALHELRSDFEPLLWNAGSDSDLEQIWFLGAHSDVGGGYPAGEDGHSNIAMQWMASEAERMELAIDRNGTYWTPSAQTATIHHEIRSIYRATKPTPRSWLTEENSTYWETHRFHSSTLNHVTNSDKVMYAFKPPRVNTALKRVDALALPRAVCLALIGNG